MNNKTNEISMGIMLGKKDYHRLRETLSDMNPVNVAQFLQDLPQEQVTLVFRMLPKKQAMDVFAELETDQQQYIIESITDKEIHTIINELAVDDAVDLLEEIPASLVKRVLKNASPDVRRTLNQFLLYPENSVGSIMTTEYTDLRKDMTVKDAIERIRAVGEDRETIYTCYVIDDSRMLEGVVTVRDLMIANDEQILEEIMNPNVIYVSTSEDQETAVNLLAKYGFIALPVVDNESRLVGLVTFDDAVDILQEEATEDFERMAGMKPSEKPYLKTSVFSLAKNRFLWLLILMFSGMISEKFLNGYEALVAAVPLLATFIPMLTDTAGDAGSQVSTLVIRGMALGDIQMKDVVKIIGKEIGVSFMVGIPLAIVNFIRVIIQYPSSAMVAIAISVTLLCTIILANTIGGFMPILAKFFKMDPALMAAPLIATIVDILSVIIYFAIATALLGSLV